MKALSSSKLFCWQKFLENKIERVEIQYHSTRMAKQTRFSILQAVSSTQP